MVAVVWLAAALGCSGSGGSDRRDAVATDSVRGQDSGGGYEASSPDVAGSADAGEGPIAVDGPVFADGASEEGTPETASDGAVPDLSLEAPSGFDSGPQPGLDGPVSMDAPFAPPVPPPAVSSAARKLLPDGWELMGTHLTACSHGPASVGQRWCAVSSRGARLGARELWVINVTSALAGPVACDGSSPGCLKLTDSLFTGRPNDGPRYPGSHRFAGDTLIFYASATSAPGDLFRGTAMAWRPGWAGAKAISSSNGTLCAAHGTAPVATCLENVTGFMPGDTLRYDLHAGLVDAGALPLVATLLPRHPVTEAVSASFDFNKAGDTLLFSNLAGAGLVWTESLYFIKVADAGKLPPTKVADGASRFRLSGDETRWYYLRDYNYSTTGVPSGTLTTSDFPAGTNERAIVSAGVPGGITGGVGEYTVLVDAAGRDAGLGVLVNVTDGRGDYRIVPRPEDPATVVNVAAGSLGLPLPSPDLRFSIHATSRAFDIGTTDFRVARHDGSAGCALTNSTRAALFGFPFSAASSLVFWADNYEQSTDSGQGWVANPIDCSNKRMFSSSIDYWFIHGEELVLYTDQGDGQTASLRVATINAGQLSSGTLLQQQIGRTYAILPEWNAAVFTLTTTTAAVNGIYHIPIR